MKISSGSKLVVIGDSITEASRRFPVGEGADGLGQGYVAMADAMLGAFRPGHGIRIVNMGVSGNTIRDLKARWNSDVIDQRPDWLAIMIGINDVWRQFDRPLVKDLHVGLDEFEATYEELLEKTAPRLKGIILMTPFYLEPNLLEPMRVLMDTYGGVVYKMARKHSASLVDVQAAFEVPLRHNHPMALASDRIHPNAVGHMIIARAFLECAGLTWPKPHAAAPSR